MAYIKTKEDVLKVCFTIPLLVRVLELVREDVKSDVNLHKVLEVLLQLSVDRCLTMDDYMKIAEANPK